MLRVFLLIALITACGPVEEKATVYKGDRGDVGQSGSSGADGKNGLDGSSCSVADEFDADNLEIVGSRISCEDGSFSIVLNGADGLGLDGEKGSSCSVTREADATFVTISCTDGTSVNVNDGEGGPAGQDASGTTIKSYTSTECSAIEGSDLFVKPNGKNAGLFSDSDCHPSSKEFELGEGDSYWLASDMIAVKLDDTGIRTIRFNN
jgi:hypothetical protein